MRVVSLIFVLIFLSCTSGKKEKPLIKEVRLESANMAPGPDKLSEWGLFEQPMHDLTPAEGVIPYELNTPLFSDYAFKKRFVKVPGGMTAGYQKEKVLDFPEGTILIKNFYYPADFSKPNEAIRIIETRLLIQEMSEWKALTYVWNEEQTEANLRIAGRSIPISWTDEKGVLKNVNYSVPNLNQCKGCHEFNGRQTPIGPTVRQLNKDLNGGNQLVNFQKIGLVTGLPDQATWDKMPAWDHPESGTLDQRARVWLEVNCAHCHRPEGPAKNTGLYLTYFEKDPYKLGINKPPVAAGRGSVGLKYGIVPGKPEQSILFNRIESLDPGVMMPELGRKLRHEEGITLIKNWITSMPANN